MIWPPNAELCPTVARQSLDRYAQDGVPTGGFLRAVLENDLKEAVGRADHINGPNLAHILAYCYEHIPSASWGTPEKVERWIERHRKERQNADG